MGGGKELMKRRGREGWIRKGGTRRREDGRRKRKGREGTLKGERATEEGSPPLVLQSLSSAG